MDPFAIPGCTFIGFIAADSVNNGRPVPLFAPGPPPPGELSINTQEGWNTAAEKQNRRSFRADLGRDPVDGTELHNWINANT